MGTRDKTRRLWYNGKTAMQEEAHPMTLTIELNPQEEAWIAAQAAQQSLPPADIVKQLIDACLPSTPTSAAATPAQPPTTIDAENAAAIALLNSYLETEATDDPEEIRKAEEELAEFKRNMNANRAATGERLVFP